MNELVGRERLIKELTEAISRRSPAFTKEENDLITTGLRLAIKIVNLSPAADVPEIISRQQEMIDGLIAGQETLQKVIADKNNQIDELLSTRLENRIKSKKSTCNAWLKQLCYTVSR